jgi:hypothetical protein
MAVRYAYDIILFDYNEKNIFKLAGGGKIYE